MDLMKNLPKLDSKKLVAGAFIALMAIGAFVFGTYRGRTQVAPSDKTETAQHGEKTEQGQGQNPAEDKGHGKDQHAKDDGHGGKEKQVQDKGHGEDKRTPASVHGPDHSEPKSNREVAPEEDDVYAEDVEVQIAHPVAKEDHRGPFTKLVDTYASAILSVNEKVRLIYRAEEENRKLKLENAYLRVMVESQNFSCRADASKKKTETVGKKLAAAAGSKAARSLASIRYTLPANLLPEQLHTLGVSYFKARDDEKAAVILNFLVELEEDDSFKTAENYLMAGVSLYRLENYHSAQDHFDKIEKMSGEDEVTLKAKRQASYWNALVADRLRDTKRAQKIILENLEKNPHTKEARWVNPKGLGNSTKGSHESKRTPAAATDKDSHHETHKATEHH